TTKTGRARRVPIEPTLRPLLEAMQGDDDQAVIEIPVGGGFAEVLRSDLVRAGCDRAALTANDATRRPLSFHDLRHTYGTWRAVRGDDTMKISRAMGHTNVETTQRYINDAEVFD